MSDFVEKAIESVKFGDAVLPQSPEVFSTLLERIVKERERSEVHARIRELAKQRGVRPIRRLEDLQGDFWPEDESVDDFLTWVRELRK